MEVCRNRQGLCEVIGVDGSYVACFYTPWEARAFIERYMTLPVGAEFVVGIIRHTVKAGAKGG